MMIYFCNIWQYIYLVSIIVCFEQTGFADSIIVTRKLVSWNGNIYGFETSDPNLILKIPKSWEIDGGKIFAEGDEYFFSLAPVYYESDLSKFLEKNPNSIILPAPHRVSNPNLFLANDEDYSIGSIKESLTGEDGLSLNGYLYYKITVESHNQKAFHALLTSHTGIFGSIDYKYAGSGSSFESAVPIVIKSEKIVNPAAVGYGAEWIESIITDHCLEMGQVIEIKYSSFKQGVACWIQDSLKIEKIDKEWHFAAPPSAKNLVISGWVVNHKLALQFPMSVNFSVDFQLDIERFKVDIVRIKFRGLSLNKEGAIGDLFLTISRNRKKMVEVVVESLAAEFQKQFIGNGINYE